MKTIKLASIFSLIIFNLSAQTNFNGGIYKDTEWTLDKSPYIIKGDVVLFPDKTLTIQPGVEIKFDGQYFLEIRGILISKGTKENNIKYTSNQINPKKGDWVGVKIKNNQKAKASFEYSNFSYAVNANSVECCWEGGPIYFKNCKFDNNLTAMSDYTGFEIEVDSCEFTNNNICISHADKKVTNSSFVGNDYGLFATERVSVSNSNLANNKVALYGGRQLISKCNIINNGIAVQSFFEGFELRSNVIQNNDTALILGNYDGYYPPVKDNQICNNKINVINTDDINKDLTGNCWCTSDSATIEDKLIDGYDNIYLGLFNYDIYETNCSSKLKSVKKVDLGTGIFVANSNIISIFPNPIISNFNIVFSKSNVQSFDISIRNMLGQEVYKGKETGNQVNIQFDNIKSGIYLCQIKTGALIINKKIIKK